MPLSVVSISEISILLIFYVAEYRNNPKFSDRKDWANSADPDQTPPRGAV